MYLLQEPTAYRESYAKVPPVLEIPDLIQIQLNSFRWFQEQGLRELFEGLSIQDFNSTRLQLRFLSYEFRQSKYSEWACREREITYSAPLYAKVRLEVKETGEIKEQDIEGFPSGSLKRIAKPTEKKTTTPEFKEEIVTFKEIEKPVRGKRKKTDE